VSEVCEEESVHNLTKVPQSTVFFGEWWFIYFHRKREYQGRNKCVLRIFEMRMVRKIYGPIQGRE